MTTASMATSKHATKEMSHAKIKEKKNYFLITAPPPPPPFQGLGGLLYLKEIHAADV